MGYRIAATETFAHEYENVLDYLVDVLGSAQAATSLVDALDNVESILSEQPEINAISPKSALLVLDLREHFVKNYVLVYRIEDEVVYLEHLFHQSQDFGRLA